MADQETYKIGALWGPRRESPEACEQRIVRFLACIGHCDVALTKWYRTGSRKNLKEITTQGGANSVLSVLMESVNRSEEDNRPIPDLGFSFWAWNGVSRDSESAGISIICGGYSAGLKNSCTLTLPCRGRGAAQILRNHQLIHLLECTVKHWGPERASIRSRIGDASVDWATYLSLDATNVPQLPRASKVIPLDTGILVISTDESFTVRNSHAMNLALEMQKAISNL